jgi:hypothetical protein
VNLVLKPNKHSYTEAEAAKVLGTSVAQLETVLDEHIFNDGTPRPSQIELQASDLLLIAFWLESSEVPESKVLPMPRRVGE